MSLLALRAAFQKRTGARRVPLLARHGRFRKLAQQCRLAASTLQLEPSHDFQPQGRGNKAALLGKPAVAPSESSHMTNND